MATYSVIKFGKGPRSEGAVIERKGWFSTTRWVKVLDEDSSMFDRWVNKSTGKSQLDFLWDGGAFYKAQELANG